MRFHEKEGQNLYGKGTDSDRPGASVLFESNVAVRGILNCTNVSDAGVEDCT